MNTQLQILAAILRQCTPGAPSTAADPCVSLPNVLAGSEQIRTVLQITFGIIGAVALIYMALAGLKFVNSQGKPEAVAAARQSIIYGAIGLVIAASAEIIVTFVLVRL